MLSPISIPSAETIRDTNTDTFSTMLLPILFTGTAKGRHVAPMGVKFSMEDGTKVPLLHAKFNPLWCNNKGVGPQKLKFLLRFDENVVSIAQFSQNLQSLYSISGCVSC